MKQQTEIINFTICKFAKPAKGDYVKIISGGFAGMIGKVDYVEPIIDVARVTIGGNAALFKIPQLQPLSIIKCSTDVQKGDRIIVRDSQRQNFINKFGTVLSIHNDEVMVLLDGRTIAFPMPLNSVLTVLGERAPKDGLCNSPK